MESNPVLLAIYAIIWGRFIGVILFEVIPEFRAKLRPIPDNAGMKNDALMEYLTDDRRADV